MIFKIAWYVGTKFPYKDYLLCPKAENAPTVRAIPLDNVFLPR